MKKIFTLFILLLALNTIQSQTYHPLVKASAYWHEVDVHCPGWPCSYYYIDYYFPSNFDVIINQKTYKILETYNGDYVFIREDSAKKVFLFQTTNIYVNSDTNEILLYDFNLHIGDTLISRVSNESYINIISGIDSININGEFRKRFHINRANYNYPYYWIEGIGSSMGLLGNYLMPFEGSHELICYNDSSIHYVSPQFNDCGGYTGISESITNTPKIFPNPATDYIHIENITTKTTAEIYSIDGKLQKSVILTDKAIISIKDLYKGIHILKLNTEKDYTYHKFIKQ